MEIIASVMNNEGKPDGMLEFALYKDQEHAERCALKIEHDYNLEAVGELHAIFMHKDQSGQRRALALCAHVKVGEENKGLGTYINELAKSALPVSKEQPIEPGEIIFNPLQCFNQGSFTDGKPLPEAPFVSLALGSVDIGPDGYAHLKAGSSDIFYRGVNAIHLPDCASVTISLEQLEVLERAQPVLQIMEPFTNVMPIQRVAGGRA